MKKEDFEIIVNADGYTIKYKGHPIGGAGIIGKSKSRGKGRAADMANYRESANRDINSLINGGGYPHMINAIKQIDLMKQ